ncbi:MULTISPECIES: aminoglycoside phosphotransferase family protein [unclassified Streptomyces]|uniref:phosphotransferase family protein n=1 Tax=unclassified Streptomyces TaxID=2593676 RepID=UPI00081E5DC2|nr:MULTISPECIES: aminoglycoside phosphotransferase family protein [unclassified Streptomyces]SCF21829.1 Predicted kinase, aminoglycoside phosphotransferase (APT) family [Streptomyces sp. LcepLS]
MGTAGVVGAEAAVAWARRVLPEGDRVVGAERLRGGWTSEMRRLEVRGASGSYGVVLRSFVKEFYVRHAAGLLRREADVLGLLEREVAVPAARCLGVEPAGEPPSLLMTLLPGGVRLDEDGAEGRADLLARQLRAIHEVRPAAAERPRVYEAWTSPARVRVPEGTRRPDVWARAVDIIGAAPPSYAPRFLHRDFHPGNVLFTGAGAETAVSGVVDWVETSWGPVDLDVAHCSTALALLHGVPAGMRFVERYVAAGGTPSPEPSAHLYWRLLDALAFAPDAEKVAVPWRELGRTDLTPALLGERLEEYVAELLRRYD